MDGISKSFGDFKAVNDVSLKIYKGEIFCLLGASGCGKTTLLRMLGGFETPSAGKIFIDGEDMTGVPPYERPVNMMFQSYALFPHMNVEQNVAFGLKQDRVPKAEIQERVATMLDLVKLGDFAKRKPHQLSGGQRQRVALARSLVKRPKLLLLDEPLGALDKKLREHTQFELISLQDKLGVTFVVVTHDQEEAMTLASRIGVMNHGEIVQAGTPSEIYEFPEFEIRGGFHRLGEHVRGQTARGRTRIRADRFGGTRRHDLRQPRHQRAARSHRLGGGAAGEDLHVHRAARGHRQCGARRRAGHRVSRRSVDLPGEAAHRQGGARDAAQYLASCRGHHLGSAGVSVLGRDQPGGGDPLAPRRQPDDGVRLLRRFGITGRGLVVVLPYLWLLLFFVVPFVIVLKISFSDIDLAIPPYKPLLEWVGKNSLAIKVNFNNYAFLFTDRLYVNAFLNSIKVAFISTVLCLLVGYPMAYGIARAKPSTRNVLLLLVILPFWTSLLLRVYAWIGLLKANGVINNVLIWLGVIHEPLTMLYTPFAMYVGIVYSYLPFLILPLYANLEKMDWQLLEAAEDLGCRPWQAFYKITLPLSRNGILAGSMLVFIPAVGEFVIPALLGGPNALMIGRVLWDEFFSNRAWPVASAVAILLLILLVPFMMWYQSVQARESAGAR